MKYEETKYYIDENGRLHIKSDVQYTITNVRVDLPEDDMNEEKIKQAADIIYMYIHWENSPQGGNYWRTVYDNLLCLAEKKSEDTITIKGKTYKLVEVEE